MSAVKTAKIEAANNKLADIAPHADWRGARGAAAKAWLLANGWPHKRDHFWSYTDPKRLEGNIGSAHSPLPSFDNKEGENVQIRNLAEAGFANFGALVANAHERGARPMAELCLLQAEGQHIKVEGAGGQIVLDRDEWGENHYIGIELAEGASLTIIETGSKPANRRAVIEAWLGAGATLDHIRIAGSADDIYHAHIFARLDESADFRSFTLAGASQFRRFETIIDLDGAHARASTAGANLLLGQSFHDDTVYVNHNAAHCTSRQVFKRVVKADAHSIFQGKIYVKEGAQKTDGYQISQGLLLEDGAEVLSKPELEIYADDVVCSHGSTSSGLDGNSLFYLQSRGIDRAQAERLLVRAFIEEAIEEIRDEGLAEKIGAIAEDWIFGEAL